MTMVHYKPYEPKPDGMCHMDGKRRYTCPICEKTFLAQGVAGHMYGVHGYRVGIRGDVARLAQRVEELEERLKGVRWRSDTGELILAQEDAKRWGYKVKNEGK